MSNSTRGGRGAGQGKGGGRKKAGLKAQFDPVSLAAREDPYPMASQPLSAAEAMVQLRRFQRELSFEHLMEMVQSSSAESSNPFHTGEAQRAVLSVTIPVAHVDPSQGLATVAGALNAFTQVEMQCISRNEDGRAVSNVSDKLILQHCKADLVLMAALAASWSGALPASAADLAKADEAQRRMEKAQEAFEAGASLFEYADSVDEMTGARAPPAVHMERLREELSGVPRLKAIRFNWIYISRRGDIFAELADAWNNLALYLMRRWAEEKSHEEGTGCLPSHFPRGSFLRKKWDNPLVEEDTDEKRARASMAAESARIKLATQRATATRMLTGSIDDLVGQVDRARRALQTLASDNDYSGNPLPPDALAVELGRREGEVEQLEMRLQKARDDLAWIVNAGVRADLGNDQNPVHGNQDDAEAPSDDELQRMRVMEFGLNWDTVPENRQQKDGSVMTWWERLLFDTGKFQPHTHATGLGSSDVANLIRHSRAGRLFKVAKGPAEAARSRSNGNGDTDAMDVDAPTVQVDLRSSVEGTSEAASDRYSNETCLIDPQSPLRLCAKWANQDADTAIRVPCLPVVASHGLHASMLSYVTADVAPEQVVPHSYFAMEGVLPFNAQAHSAEISKLSGAVAQREFQALAERYDIPLRKYDTMAELNAAILVKMTERDVDAQAAVPALSCAEKATLLKLYAKMKGYPDRTLVEEIAPAMTHPAALLSVLLPDASDAQTSSHLFHRLRHLSRITDGEVMGEGTTLFGQTCLFGTPAEVRAAMAKVELECNPVNVHLPSHTEEERHKIVEQSTLIAKMRTIMDFMQQRLEIQRTVFSSVPMLEFWQCHRTPLDAPQNYGARDIVKSPLTPANAPQTYVKFSQDFDILGAVCGPERVNRTGNNRNSGSKLMEMEEPTVSFACWQSLVAAATETFRVRLHHVVHAKSAEFTTRCVGEIPNDVKRFVEVVPFHTPDKKLGEGQREAAHAVLWRVLSAPSWDRINEGATSESYAFQSLCDPGFRSQCWSHTTISTDATAVIARIKELRENPRRTRTAAADALLSSSGSMSASRGFGRVTGQTVSHCGFCVVGPIGSEMSLGNGLERNRWEKNYAALIGAFHRYADLFAMNQQLPLLLYACYLSRTPSFELDAEGKPRPAKKRRYHQQEYEEIIKLVFRTLSRCESFHSGFKWCNARPALITEFLGSNDNECYASSGVRLLRVSAQVVREILFGNRGGQLLYNAVPHERLFNTAPNIRSMVASYIMALKDSFYQVGVGSNETKHMMTLAFLIWMQLNHVSMPQPDTKLYLAFFVLLSGVTAAGKSALVGYVSTCAFPETIQVMGTLSEQALSADGNEERVLRYVDELSEELFNVHSRGYKPTQVAQIKEAVTSGQVTRTRNNGNNEDTGKFTSKTDVISSHWNLLASSNHKYSGEVALTKRFTHIGVPDIVMRGRRHIADTTAGRAGSLAAMNDAKRLLMRNAAAIFPQNIHMVKMAIEHLIEMGLLRVDAEVMQSVSVHMLNRLKAQREFHGLMIRSIHTFMQLIRSETAAVASMHLNTSYWNHKVVLGQRDCYPRLDWRYISEVAQPALIPSLEVAAHVGNTFFHQVADKPEEAEIFRTLCKIEYEEERVNTSTSERAFHKLKFPVVTRDLEGKEPGSAFASGDAVVDHYVHYADQKGMTSRELALDTQYVVFELAVNSKKAFYQQISMEAPNDRRMSEQTIASVLELLEDTSIDSEGESRAMAHVMEGMAAAIKRRVAALQPTPPPPPSQAPAHAPPKAPPVPPTTATPSASTQSQDEALALMNQQQTGFLNRTGARSLGGTQGQGSKPSKPAAAPAAPTTSTTAAPTSAAANPDPAPMGVSDRRKIVEGAAVTLENMLSQHGKIVITRVAPGRRVKAIEWRMPSNPDARRNRERSARAADGVGATGQLQRAFEHQERTAASSGSNMMQLRVHWNLVARFLTDPNGPSLAQGSVVLGIITESLRDMLPHKLFPPGPLARPPSLRAPIPGDLDLFQTMRIGDAAEMAKPENTKRFAARKKELEQSIKAEAESVTFVIGYVGNTRPMVDQALLDLQSLVALETAPDEKLLWTPVRDAITALQQEDVNVLTVDNFDVQPNPRRGVGAKGRTPVARIPVIHPFEGSSRDVMLHPDSLSAFLDDSTLPDVFDAPTALAVMKPDFPVGHRQVAVRVAFLRNWIRKTEIGLQWHPDIYSLFEYCAAHQEDPLEPAVANALQHRAHSLLSKELDVSFQYAAPSFPVCEVDTHLMNELFTRIIEGSYILKQCASFLNPMRGTDPPTTLVAWANRLRANWRALLASQTTTTQDATLARSTSIANSTSPFAQTASTSRAYAHFYDHFDDGEDEAIQPVTTVPGDAHPTLHHVPLPIEDSGHESDGESARKRRKVTEHDGGRGTPLQQEVSGHSSLHAAEPKRKVPAGKLLSGSQGGKNATPRSRFGQATGRSTTKKSPGKKSGSSTRSLFDDDDAMQI